MRQLVECLCQLFVPTLITTNRRSRHPFLKVRPGPGAAVRAYRPSTKEPRCGDQRPPENACKVSRSPHPGRGTIDRSEAPSTESSLSPEKFLTGFASYARDRLPFALGGGNTNYARAWGANFTYTCRRRSRHAPDFGAIAPPPEGSLFSGTVRVFALVEKVAGVLLHTSTAVFLARLRLSRSPRDAKLFEIVQLRERLAVGRRSGGGGCAARVGQVGPAAGTGNDMSG